MQTNDFSQGSVSRQIIRLGLPMIGAQLINALYNIVDRIFIGRMEGVGTLAITGVGVTFPVVMLVSAFASLAGMGGAPLCSIARGAGNHDRGEKILGNVVSLLTLFGVGMTLLGLIFKEPLLYLFGASGDTFPFASDYLGIYLIGSLAVMYALGLNPMISSQGFGKTAMMTVMIGAVLNIALDPVFIFVMGLGVKGAALATVVSQFVSAGWVIRFLTGKKALLKMRPQCLRLEWKMVKSICALGLSTFIMTITESAVLIAFNTQLQLFGGDLYVGVMTVLNSLKQVTNMPLQGLTQGAQPVMGFNFGAKKYGRVRQAVNFLTVACLIYGVATAVLCLAIPGPLMGIFNNDPSLISSGVPMMRIFFCMNGVMALQLAAQNAFVALNRSKEAMFFASLRKLVLLIPLIYVLPGPVGLGVMGVFLAEPIADTISALSCYITFRLTAWKELGRES
ncbi:MAG: MATE family efflux transporter [Clostridia bacterium]|nr:MATE family efflux transporter [Clostridia bacterium]